MNDVYINTKVIVVGSGMSGGWAAKELLRKGIKEPVVLERGVDVKHVKDYPTVTLQPWITHRNMVTEDDLKTYPIQSKVYHFGEDNKIFCKRYRTRLRAGKTLSMEPRLSCWCRSLRWSRHTFR